VAPQDSLPDAAALQRRLAEVVAAGGEGLVLHRADAPYQVGRSDALLKLKPVQDADAVVVGHLPGQGKYQGRTGALKVRDAKGREFLIGSGLTDAQRGSPPPLGSTVSYRWRGLTRSGLPRFASLWRVREAGW
jgi:DNA ligase-1